MALRPSPNETVTEIRLAELQSVTQCPQQCSRSDDREDRRQRVGGATNSAQREEGCSSVDRPGRFLVGFFRLFVLRHVLSECLETLGDVGHQPLTLPRPNSSSTTMMTTIQCQRLRPSIGESSAIANLPP